MLNVLRAFVRQIAAAVYVFMAWGIAAWLLRKHPWVEQTEPLFVFFGGVLIALLVDGPWWTSAFVGFFVAALDVAFVLLTRGEGDIAVRQLIVVCSILVASGALGAMLGRWQRRRHAATPAGS